MMVAGQSGEDDLTFPKLNETSNLQSNVPSCDLCVIGYDHAYPLTSGDEFNYPVNVAFES